MLIAFCSRILRRSLVTEDGKSARAISWQWRGISGCKTRKKRRKPPRCLENNRRYTLYMYRRKENDARFLLAIVAKKVTRGFLYFQPDQLYMFQRLLRLDTDTERGYFDHQLRPGVCGETRSDDQRSKVETWQKFRTRPNVLRFLFS